MGNSLLTSVEKHDDVIIGVKDIKDKNKKEENNKNNNEDMEIYLTLKRADFTDERDEKRFIKSVEKLIRASREYKEWIAFVKYTLQNDFCVVSLETDEETKDIEIHHHPISLYALVKILIYDKINRKEKFTSFEIAEKAIELHFKLKIGFVPLLRSLHKKFHNGYLDIPIELVRGDYKYILENYFIPDDVLDVIKYYESITLERLKNKSKMRNEEKEELIDLMRKLGLLASKD